MQMTYMKCTSSRAAVAGAQVTSFVVTDQDVGERNVLQRTANQRVGNVLFIDGKEVGLLKNVTAADTEPQRQGKEAR